MGNELGCDAQISRFFKGVSKLRPQRPRYQSTWDLEPVLQYLESLQSNKEMSLENLTKKLVTILALCTAQRAQTLWNIEIDNITETENVVEIRIPAPTKTSGLNNHQPIFQIDCIYSTSKSMRSINTQ